MGAFSAGYWLLPTFGLSRTGFMAIGGNFAVALIAFMLTKRYGAVDADGVQQESNHNVEFFKGIVEAAKGERDLEKVIEKANHGTALEAKQILSELE